MECSSTDVAADVRRLASDSQNHFTPSAPEFPVILASNNVAADVRRLLPAFSERFSSVTGIHPLPQLLRIAHSIGRSYVLPASRAHDSGNVLPEPALHLCRRSLVLR